MHENAKRILKKIAISKSGVGLADLAKLFQAEAKKLLTAKGSKRSAEAVAAQASSMARNHLRTLVSEGYIKRVGRGEYTSTAKKATAKKATAKKVTAKKAPAKRATAKKAPAKRATAKKAPAKKAKPKKALAKAKAKAKKAPAKKAKPKKAPARKAKKAKAQKSAAGLRAELTKIKQQLRQLTARVKKLGSSL